MIEPVWLFQECNSRCPLSSLGLAVKTDLRSARARIRALSASVVDVVYHWPWHLPTGADSDAETTAGLWLDFVIDALALKQEFHDRVRLWPADAFVRSRKHDDLVRDWPGSDSLAAWLMQQRNPAMFEVLESLESCAELQGRAPFVRQAQGRLSAAQVGEIEQLLAERTELLAARETMATQQLQMAAADTRLSATEAALQSAQTESMRLQQELMSVQESFERVVKEKSDVQAQLKDAQIQFKDVQAQLKDAQAQPKYPDLSGRLRELEQSLASEKDNRKKADKDMERLVLQLHQVQEELERQYLDFQALRRESQLAERAMESAARKLLALKPEARS